MINASSNVNLAKKVFFTKGKLRSHMMSVHIKERPYSCRYGCEMTYNDSSNIIEDIMKVKNMDKFFLIKKLQKFKGNLGEKVTFKGLDICFIFICKDK